MLEFLLLQNSNFLNKTFYLKKIIFYIYIYIYCGVKELSSPSPLHTGLKAHAEEEETPEDEQRKSQLSRDIAEDNPVLGRPKSRERRRHALKDNLPERPKQKGLT